MKGILGFIAVFAAIAVSVSLYLSWRDEQRIMRIQPGVSLDEVVAILGPPSMRYETRSGREDWPGHRCELVEGGEVLLYSRKLKESVHVFSDSDRTKVECVERVSGGVFYNPSQ